MVKRANRGDPRRSTSVAYNTLMHVLAPFSLKSEVVPLVAAGANELYCGVVPEELSQRWGTLELLNRRRGYDANLWSFADLREAVVAAHECGVPVFVTLNRHYPEDLYPLLHEMLARLREVDTDGVVVVDLGLLQLLREQAYGFRHVIVGTGGATLNAETVAFYGALGATRIVLSRHLTVPEIVDITAHNDAGLELEAFVLNGLCPFEDGFCTFYHGHEPPRHLGEGVDWRPIERSYDPVFEGAGCRINFVHRRLDVAGGAEPTGAGCETFASFAHDRSDESRTGGTDCGACAILALTQASLTSVKIVERAFSTDRKVRCTRFVRAVVDLAEAADPPAYAEFVAEVRRRYATFTGGRECSGYECYYPVLGPPPSPDDAP